jgi:hypothetical protein
MRDVCIATDAAEAGAIEALLLEHAIEALVLSFSEMAIDGLSPTAQRWGRIRVGSEDAAHAKAIIEKWRSARPVTVPSGGAPGT